MTSDTTTDDYVQLFDRRVPVPALTLLLRLEDEGYDVWVDTATTTKQLCIKPTVPASERAAITKFRAYLIIMVEGTMQLLADEQEAERGTRWELT